MPSFEYQAVDPHGKKTRGYIDADSERQARQNLREKSLIPVSLSATAQKSASGATRSGRVATRDIALFTQQFAALVQSAIPLEEALQVAADQTRNKVLRRVLKSVRSRILEGHTLAEGMKDHPKVFPPIYCALVSAGEHSGDLGKVLMRLADYTERTQQLRSTVMQAAIYPAVLTLVSIGVITLLMAYVVPKVVEQFDGVGQQLPLLTRIMISISDFIVNSGWLVLAVLIAAGFIWKQLLKNEAFLTRIHRLMLRIPGLGSLITQLETARLLNTLSIMVNSGSPLLESLKISRETLHNRVIRQAVADATERVREGQLLSKTLADSKVFPPISVYMIANGEHSGELGQSLDHAARQQENLLTSVISVATRLIEPLLIIIFGALVLAIVLAILLPILQLNNLTQF